MDQLKERMQSTIRGENQVIAIRAKILPELRRREGPELVGTVLREDGLLSRRRARSELPHTVEGLRKGEISFDNARIIAGASRRGEIDEGELADVAKTQSPDKFAGTVRKHEQQRSEDDGVAKLTHQQSRRYAKISADLDDGMIVLYGRFDPITGARIESVLSNKMDQLWRAEDPRNRVTPGQRLADALEMLLTRPGEDDVRSQGVKLLMIAEHDVISGELGKARLPDGTPIPVQKVRELAVTPKFFPPRSQSGGCHCPKESSYCYSQTPTRSGAASFGPH